jgi:hypothetical protein
MAELTAWAIPSRACRIKLRNSSRRRPGEKVGTIWPFGAGTSFLLGFLGLAILPPCRLGGGHCNT